MVSYRWSAAGIVLSVCSIDCRVRWYSLRYQTSFIKEWWESEDSVTLITRPRRFWQPVCLHMKQRAADFIIELIFVFSQRISGIFFKCLVDILR